MNTSIVYAIECAGFSYFKIGVTRNISNRIKTMQCGCPFELSVAFSREFPASRAFSIEYSAHKRFSQKRIRGEWFHVDIQEIADFISEQEYIEPKPKFKEEQFLSRKATKADVRAAVGAANDHQLALTLGVSPPRIYHYKEDQKISEGLYYRAQNYLRERCSK